jgi:starch phosphorylase
MAPIVQEIRTIAHFVAPTSEKLWELARNLWWSWDNDAGSLFRDIDPVRWAELGQNPIKLLNEIPLDELERRAGDLVLHSRVNYTYRRFREYLQSSETWGTTHAGVLGRQPVAYFSAEFGLHESVPIYSGGLGVLAGDHIKSASDLGVPLVGIGLFYSQGYFRQRLDADAWQGEEYLKVDPAELPFTPALGKNGEPVTVAIETRTGTIQAKVWSVAVGRCLLLLLDSNLEGNAPEDRELTARLYGGDTRVRIRQELLLGVGGVRALRTMGISPGLLHLNEGHSAFAVFEAIRERMVDDGLDFEGSTRRVHRRVVFTTHTPVPAGHDRFPESLVEEHLGPLRDALGRSVFDFMSLGRVNPDDPSETFCMTVLALKLSRRANAVSSLHGEVSRAMWTSLWPNRVEDAVPIGHITNGVHVLSWLAPQMFRLYRRHLGSGWHRLKGATEDWKNIEEIDDGELWETHLALKSRLLKFARRRSVRQAERRGALPAELERLSRVLSPDALTIGFARRFATYKRAALLFSDEERLSRILDAPDRPVQIVIAGKAHPADRPGQQVIQHIFELSRSDRLRGRVFIVEDYDMRIAHFLVAGVDIWLNNPRRPMEASGTSGMKAAINGIPSVSILDGWWDEGFNGHNGWAIGDRDPDGDEGTQDASDAAELYRLLEEEIVPRFFERDDKGLPMGWLEVMRASIAGALWQFSTARMVTEYVDRLYLPTARGAQLSSVG